MDASGNHSVVPIHKWGFNRIPYDSGCRWWESDFEAKSLSGRVHFTKASKEEEEAKMKEEALSRPLSDAGIYDIGETTGVGKYKKFKVRLVAGGERLSERLEAELCSEHF